jgi:hypothetical protein
LFFFVRFLFVFVGDFDLGFVAPPRAFLQPHPPMGEILTIFEKTDLVGFSGASWYISVGFASIVLIDLVDLGDFLLLYVFVILLVLAAFRDGLGYSPGKSFGTPILSIFLQIIHIILSTVIIIFIFQTFKSFVISWICAN